MRDPIPRSIRLAASLILTACGDKTPKPDNPSPLPEAVPVAAVPIETTPFVPALAVDLSASTKTPSGLYYRDLTVGTGAEAIPGKLLSVKYAGRLPNGTQFDAGTYDFHIGAREAIEGWDVGIAGMKVGGKRQLIIPYTLGYGAAGRGPIPPYGTMVFDVELLAVK
jgi:hypothetical protein